MPLRVKHVDDQVKPPHISILSVMKPCVYIHASNFFIHTRTMKKNTLPENKTMYFDNFILI